MLQWSCPFCEIAISSVSVAEHIQAIAEHARDWHDIADSVMVLTALSEGEQVVALAKQLDRVLVARKREHAIAAVAMIVAGLFIDLRGEPIVGFVDFMEQVNTYTKGLRQLRLTGEQ
jgi:hypothetical protein